MLVPSSLDKDENSTKNNQVDRLKFIFRCFISLLSIGHRTIKRDATWWPWQNQNAQNLERFHEWCKEIKFQECTKICHTDQTGIAHRSDHFNLSKSKSGPPDLSDPFTTRLVRSLYRLLELFAGHVWSWTRLVRQTIWPLEFELHQTCPTITGYVRLLTQICQFKDFPTESALSPVGVTLSVWPVWWTGLTSRVWQPQWLVF
jgi:hypothetical protein